MDVYRLSLIIQKLASVSFFFTSFVNSLFTKIRMDVYNISFTVYNLVLIPVVFISSLYFVLAISNIAVGEKRSSARKNDKLEWPTVTVQIPTYNDPIVVRCIKHCLKFDYPKDKFEIIVADDSTDGKTSELVEKYAKKYPEKVRVFRRNNRNGYKPGALNNILKHSNGEIIVIFDADFTPKRNFLKKIVTPMIEDEKVAIVQSRMGYINIDQNLITKMASVFMMIYHNCIITLNDRIGVAFFCGTHGAIRKEALLKVGGWNEKSITEDTELSIRILRAGYKSVYLADLRAAGELPFTLMSFVKQQTRWAYGNARVFMENLKNIWIKRGFSLPQKLAISFNTFGNVLCVFSIIMTLSAIVNWFTGVPKPITLEDIRRFLWVFIITGGFLVSAFISLFREKKLNLIKDVLIGGVTVGVLVAFTNSIAVLRAIFGMDVGWVRTPKFGSLTVYNFFKRYLGGI